MYGFVSGISDSNDINYYPKRGVIIAAYRASTTARCLDCGFVFAVIECAEDDEE